MTAYNWKTTTSLSSARKSYTVAIAVNVRPNRPDQFIYAPEHGSVCFLVYKRDRQWWLKQELYPYGNHIDPGPVLLEGIETGSLKEPLLKRAQELCDAHIAALRLGAGL